MDKVVNPYTNRLITVGGKTWKKIQSGGVPVTKGWKDAAPKKGSERHRMKEECGDKCFLEPDSEGFPVCSKSSCDIDCRGVHSAYQRARQWGHDDTAKLARKMLDKYC